MSLEVPARAEDHRVRAAPATLPMNADQGAQCLKIQPPLLAMHHPVAICAQQSQMLVLGPLAGLQIQTGLVW